MSSAAVAPAGNDRLNIVRVRRLASPDLCSSISISAAAAAIHRLGKGCRLKTPGRERGRVRESERSISLERVEWGVPPAGTGPCYAGVCSGRVFENGTECRISHGLSCVSGAWRTIAVVASRRVEWRSSQSPQLCRSPAADAGDDDDDDDVSDAWPSRRSRVSRV